MYQKTRKIIIISLLIMIGAFGLNAQTDSIYNKAKRQGEIVMTKSELVGFLKKIAEARKVKVEQDLESSDLQNVNPLYLNNNYGIGGYINPPSQQPITRGELMREFQAIHQRLNSIAGYGSGTTTIVAPDGAYPYQQGYYSNPSTPLVATSKQLKDKSGLRWEIDSLQRELSLLTTPSHFAANQDRINLLNKRLDSLQDSLIIASALTPEASEIVKKYGTSQMQVFFANDESEVAPSYLSEVEKVATALKKNPQMAVVLKGFASPVGNKKYNYDLSMRRNEAVKRLLIDYGVFPDQITSVFYGEDTKSSIDKARRVDMKFIIR